MIGLRFFTGLAQGILIVLTGLMARELGGKRLAQCVAAMSVFIAPVSFSSGGDLATYIIPEGTFKHEKVIYGVLFGKIDAGAAPLIDFERMVRDGRIDRNDFTVVAEGEPMPYCNFAVTQKVDEGLAKRFKQALLGLTKDDTVEVDGEVVKVLERAQIDGYDDSSDKDFNVVREMAKRTNMPPYQRY